MVNPLRPSQPVGPPDHGLNLAHVPGGYSLLLPAYLLPGQSQVWFWFQPDVHSSASTICLGSSYPIYKVTYYITTSWTYCISDLNRKYWARWYTTYYLFLFLSLISRLPLPSLSLSISHKPTSHILNYENIFSSSFPAFQFISLFGQMSDNISNFFNQSQKSEFLTRVSVDWKPVIL